MAIAMPAGSDDDLGDTIMGAIMGAVKEGAEGPATVGASLSGGRSLDGRSLGEEGAAAIDRGARADALGVGLGVVAGWAVLGAKERVASLPGELSGDVFGDGSPLRGGARTVAFGKRLDAASGTSKSRGKECPIAAGLGASMGITGPRFAPDGAGSSGSECPRAVVGSPIAP